MNNGSITVNSVHKAFQILDLFIEKDGPLTLGEISRYLGYPKSTVHALLSTMLAHEMVWQLEDGKYCFGYRAIEYAFGIRRDWKVAGQAEDFLSPIVEETGMAAALFAQASDYFINVSFKTSNANQHLLPNLGVRMPFSATASGKLFLSTFSPRKLEAILNAEKFYEDENAGGRKRRNLDEELETIRKTGFAVAVNSFQKDKAAVSVMIPNTEGNTQFAFTTIGSIEELGLTFEEASGSIETIRKNERVQDVADVLKKYAWQYGLAFAKGK